MLLLSKAMSQLLLPPGGLILLGVIGLIYRHKIWGRSLVLLSLSLFWLLSTEPVRDMLTKPLEFQYPALNIETIKPDNSAIVLLGGGVEANSPEYQGRDELSHRAMMRTIYAAKIAEQHDAPIYATGGTPLAQDMEAEASVMQRWLLWFGVDQARIHMESQANNTWENAVLTQILLAQQNINSIILVTSAWHMPRSVWCFEQQGLTVIPAPTDYISKQKNYDLRSYLPSWSIFADSGDALHEYLGLVWYKLKYP